MLRRLSSPAGRGSCAWQFLIDGSLFPVGSYTMVEKMLWGNAKYAYLATHFLARFFASGANLVATAGHTPLADGIWKSWFRILKRSSSYQLADITVILTGTNPSLRIETRCRHLSANKPSFLRPVKYSRIKNM
jgi:hypothetical protein